MTSYQVTRKDGATGIVAAHSFVTDGAGTRFHDVDGAVIACFNDGVIASVLDASIVFTVPSLPDAGPENKDK